MVKISYRVEQDNIDPSLRRVWRWLEDDDSQFVNVHYLGQIQSKTSAQAIAELFCVERAAIEEGLELLQKGELEIIEDRPAEDQHEESMEPDTASMELMEIVALMWQSLNDAERLLWPLTDGALPKAWCAALVHFSEGVERLEAISDTLAEASAGERSLGLAGAQKLCRFLN